MQPSLHRHDPAQEYWFEEGCFIAELSDSQDDPQLSIALACVPPGVTTKWHRLAGITERYVIQQGEGLVEIGDLPPQPVGPHDVVVIPPGCRQRVTHQGHNDLVFLALCTPRFQPQAYSAIE